jgi:uncharacterized membrane protein
MSWMVLALLAAISESFKDLFSKQGVQRVSPQLAALAACAIPVPLLLLMVIMTNSVPTLGPGYLGALCLGGSLNILALYQFMRALQASDMSLAIPFISFTPLFLLITSPMLVRDAPTPQDVAGIVCIVVGSYVLHIQSAQCGLLTPVWAAFREPGPRRMLSVAFMYSLTSNFDKIGVQNSSPLFWSLSITSVMALGFLLLLRIRPQQKLAIPNTRTLGILLLVGLFQSLGILLHNTALNLGQVPSVIAVKRSSILFAVLWGLFFLRERHLKERLGGALLMVTGIILLGFGQTE